MLSKLKELGSKYYDCYFQKDENGTKLARQNIEKAMAEISIADQKSLVDKLEFGSVAVNGQDPRETTGYGIVRDVFCTNLFGQCVNISATRLTRMQSASAESFDPKEYDNAVKQSLVALSKDQFRAFQVVAEKCEPSDELDDNARNRQRYAMDHVRGLLGEVIRERQANEAEASKE